MAEKTFCTIAAGIVAGFSFVQMIIFAVIIQKLEDYKNLESLIPSGGIPISSDGSTIPSINENLAVAVMLIVAGTISSAVLAIKDEASYIWFKMAQFTVTVAVVQNMVLVVAVYSLAKDHDIAKASFAFGIMFLIAITGFTLYTGFTESDNS